MQMEADAGGEPSRLERARLNAFLRTLKPPPEVFAEVDEQKSVFSTDSEFVQAKALRPRIGREFGKISIDIPADVVNLDITPFLDTSYIDPDPVAAEIACSTEIQARRRVYLSAVDGIEARRKRQQSIHAKVSEITELLQTGSVESWRGFDLKRRREMEAKTGSRKLCEFDRCPNAVFPGSQFCCVHILNDTEQKLFVPCEKCGRPYPKCGTCFTCPP